MNKLKPFRFFAQRVIPLVYDDSLSYYELLCKVVEQLNRLTDNNNDMIDTVNEFTEFVTHYFDNLDVQTEINHKLDVMAANGQLYALFKPYFDDLSANIDSRIDAQAGYIEVLKNRMDTFASLPAGSTSGNAELLDIRNGADGTVYSSAGEAVRKQFDKAYRESANAIEETKQHWDDISVLPITGRNIIDTNTLVGAYVKNVFNTQGKTDKIKIMKPVGTGNGLYIGFTIEGISAADMHMNARFYDKNNNELSWFAVGSTTYGNYIPNADSVVFEFANMSAYNAAKEHIISGAWLGAGLLVYEPYHEYYYSSAAIECKTLKHIKSINRLGYRKYGGGEGSMYAYRCAVRAGFDALLAAVRFTSDNVAVCCHDASINRVARTLAAGAIENTVNIADITYANTSNYDFGIAGGVSQIGATRIDELAKLSKMTGRLLYLEYKDGSFEQWDNLLGLIQSYGMEDYVYVAAGESVLKHLSANFPKFHYGYNADPNPTNIAVMREIKERHGCDVFIFGWHTAQISQYAYDMRRYGIRFEYGTVNTLEDLYTTFDRLIVSDGVESDTLIANRELMEYASRARY